METKRKASGRALIRGNWPAVLFSCILGLSVVLAIISSHAGWCEGSETSAVCARNWINAAAGLLTVFAAAAAAVFAYRQYRAAEHQNLLSGVPALERKIDTLHAMRDRFNYIAGWFISWSK
jgi:hypothetical protein